MWAEEVDDVKKIKKRPRPTDENDKHAPFIDQAKWEAFCRALTGKGATMRQLMTATGYGERTMYRWLGYLQSGALCHPTGLSPVRSDVRVGSQKVSRWILAG